jgi:hypothetical protein
MHVTKVELTGAPQRHRKSVAERRLQHEREELRQREEAYRQGEERRRESYLRRHAGMMARVPEHTRTGVDRVAHLAHVEREQQARREEIRAKHDRLEERRRAMALRNQATGDALRHLDRLTYSRIVDAEAEQRERERRLSLNVHHASLKTSAFRGHVDAEASLMHQRRQRAKADFLEVFREGNTAITKQLQRREHEAVGLHAKAVADSMAVDITWPAELSSSPVKAATRDIDGDTYARLCGFKHSFTAGQGTAITVADIANVRHVPPTSWAILHAVDPSAAHLTLQAAQANLFRGPQAVKWL